VEVYATVMDRGGRYIQGLGQKDFEVKESGQAQKITVFEADSTELTAAFLLDATGSMKETFARVKNVVVRTIDRLRPTDAVGISGFRSYLFPLQEFTTDKAEAKRAVLRTRAAGTTALFDAITKVALELAKRPGKKVMIVFSDGQDNASVLNAGIAGERAKRIGVPVYIAAMGDALKDSGLVARLQDIARTTGGAAYKLNDPDKMEEVFHEISSHMQNTYYLGYQVPAAKGNGWRPIDVVLVGGRDYRIRAREGYFLDN
jgi:Ca-activated chloride channel family protein